MNPPHWSIISQIGVPTLVIKFLGSFIASPVIVVILSIKGKPVFIDFAIWAAVPTFVTTAPAAAGNAPDGTSLPPVHAYISCFSAPCGYFISRPTTSTSGYGSAALVTASIASSLFTSIPIYPLWTSNALITALIPNTTSSGISTINLWSAVKYGSHSAPLSIITSMFESGGGDNFTCVGNVAPPIPTIPASCMIFMISFGSRLSNSPCGLTLSSSSSLKSFSITIHCPIPPGTSCIFISITLPETDECTLADTKPPAWPIICPFLTSSPFSTIGFAGAPICCWRGI